MPVIIDGTSGITTPSIDTTTPLITADGGTGTGTLTAGSVLVGNGTSAVNLVAAGSSGNVLTSNGTTWTSAAAASAQIQTELFTSPGTWTKPASCTQVRVTVIGGGGGGAPTSANTGGFGGLAVASNVPVSAPVSVTVGAGGNAGTAGATSSFGPAVSATGGAAGVPTANGAPGTGTVSVGTALRTGSYADYTPITFISVGFILGNLTRAAGPGTPAAIAYSTSSALIAGARGTGSAAVANQAGGVGGAILVEFVG